jgi:phenylacetic acid degradation operon negative regulatory protein
VTDSSAPPPDPHVERWIRREIARTAPRARSLIVTVWGDAIAPHGGAALLPGVIALLGPLGVNERLVRTSVFRLAREGWLENQAVGRRSLYRLTREGGRRFADAYRRIYAPPAHEWDGTWDVVLTERVAGHARPALRQELAWAGYGFVGVNVAVRPHDGSDRLPRIVRALGVQDAVLAFRGSDLPRGSGLAAHVAATWDLAVLAAEYRRFLARFGTVIGRFRARTPDAQPPQQAFVVRTLLIHAYRRVLLRDPQLPRALLPAKWPGWAAYGLCRDFYRLTHAAAERHLVARLATDSGSLPGADAAFYARFGGLR